MLEVHSSSRLSDNLLYYLNICTAAVTVCRSRPPPSFSYPTRVSKYQPLAAPTRGRVNEHEQTTDIPITTRPGHLLSLIELCPGDTSYRLIPDKALLGHLVVKISVIALAFQYRAIVSCCSWSNEEPRPSSILYPIEGPFGEPGESIARSLKKPTAAKMELANHPLPPASGAVGRYGIGREAHVTFLVYSVSGCTASVGFRRAIVNFDTIYEDVCLMNLGRNSCCCCAY